MKCALCKHGEMVDKIIDYQTKFNEKYVVVRNVPVQECSVCGEQLMPYETVKKNESFIYNGPRNSDKNRGVL